MSDSPIELIQLLEELAANAWPAAVVQVINGWRLRYNWGVTRRANSVWPNESGPQSPLTEKLALAEDFYIRRGLPVRFQICPAAQPANLDDLLTQRGYTSDALTCVQTASLESVLARIQATSIYPVAINETFDDEWADAYGQAEQVTPAAAEARRNILQRIGPRCGFALARANGQPVGLGLGVVERGWIGLFSLVTVPEFRRRGVGTVVLHALARWGQSHQANRIYLQVMADNASALALYAHLGFETLYYYHYRELRP